MNRYERWSALVELLTRDGSVDIASAAIRFGVSAATVRRDLNQLAEQQVVTRTRGGAVAQQVAYDLPLRYKAARHAPEKERIARAAADMVAPGSVVGLNGGTTTTEVARALATAVGLHTGRNDVGPSVTVVTNAVNIAHELTVRPHVKLVVVGGTVRPQSYELVGPLAAQGIDELSLDITFLGVNGIDWERGATTHDEAEASVNRVLGERSRQLVVVADSSKLGKVSFARICRPSAIDLLITDVDASPAAVAAFDSAGIRTVLV